MHHRAAQLSIILFLIVTADTRIRAIAQEQPVDIPHILDNRLSLELIAREPDIVTPVGIAFDSHGQLLVIESHTHFPKPEYPGPKSDRIRIVKDTNGDGRPDSFSTLFEGTAKTMSLRQGPENWLYVATRMEIFRIRDADGDDVIDNRETIATLQTKGDYPHNGLCGICFDAEGKLVFGLGENLGVDYTLIGRDGTKLSGGGEGGNIYQCELNGSHLQQIATGFWNPFGICTDSVGRLYTVGNDPDSSPPCRLVHVVPGGDYGYQFRYGRSGKHPLQAWDGELPGTLPMVAGTSEAPSAVIQWHGHLYVTSWGEYRVERFALRSNGATVSADRDIVLEGTNQFRPVDMAIAPDGSLYFTDWVDRSYNVHGKGRIWRLSWKDKPIDVSVPTISTLEVRASVASTTPTLADLRSTDPFLHHAAVMGLVGSKNVSVGAFAAARNPREKLGILEAARRSGLSDADKNRMLKVALATNVPSIQLYAVRWIADEKRTEFRTDLDVLLENVNSVQLGRGALAAIEWLDTGTVKRKSIAGESILVSALATNQKPSLQVIALKTLPGTHTSLTDQVLTNLIGSSNGQVATEAARSLATSGRDDATLLRLAQDTKLTADIRADIVSGISRSTTLSVTSVLKDAPSAVLYELTRLKRKPADSDVVTHPRTIDMTAWEELVEKPGNASAGWRVFFGRGVARCANCHAVDGRGESVGPDLTGITNRMGQTRILQSLLQPSREMAPRYVPWIIATSNGKTFTGLSLGVSNNGEEHFLRPDGTQVTLHRDTIEERALATKSIMPDDLHEHLTVQEIRDVLTYLSL